MTLEEYFENRIFEESGQHKKYEESRLIMFNCLEVFQKLDWFNKLSKTKQYEICNLSAHIALDTQLQQLNEIHILTKPEKKFYKRSINRPNSKFELITINTNDNQIKLIEL